LKEQGAKNACDDQRPKHCFDKFPDAVRLLCFACHDTEYSCSVMCLQRFAFTLDQGITLTNEAAFVEQMRSVGKVIHLIRETL
jgi:hypothetical protein